MFHVSCLSILICMFECALVHTEFSSRFNVYVVITATDADDNAKSFKLLQVFSHQSDGVVHQSSHSFIQDLGTKHMHRISSQMKGISVFFCECMYMKGSLNCLRNIVDMFKCAERKHCDCSKPDLD